MIKGLTVTSNLVFVSAFAFMFLASPPEIRSFGVSLAMIAVAALGYTVTACITTGGSWTAVMVPLIMAVTFALFSVLIHLVA